MSAIGESGRAGTAMGQGMLNSAQKRGELIRHLEQALELADELKDGATGYLIERALDEGAGPSIHANI